MLVFFGLAAPFDIKRGDWGTPIVSLIVAIAIAWGLTLIAKHICLSLGEAARFFSWFALAGFTIVLAHPAVLAMAEPFFPRWAVFVAAVLLPLAVGRIALRTPVSQWVTGVPRTSGQPVGQKRRPGVN